jgi:hypothetical protein
MGVVIRYIIICGVISVRCKTRFASLDGAQFPSGFVCGWKFVGINELHHHHLFFLIFLYEFVFKHIVFLGHVFYFFA